VIKRIMGMIIAAYAVNLVLSAFRIAASAAALAPDRLEPVWLKTLFTRILKLN